MDLRTYLFEKKMKTSVFAKQIGYSAVHLYKLISGKMKPCERLCKTIEKATDGQVILTKEKENG